MDKLSSNQCDELVRLLRQRYQDEGDTISRKAADEIDRLRALLRRVIGEHHAPRDCYSTGPLTGTARDYSCPACEALVALEPKP